MNPQLESLIASVRPAALAIARLKAVELIAKDTPTGSVETFVSLVARLAAARSSEDFLLKQFAQLGKARVGEQWEIVSSLEAMAAAIAADLCAEFALMTPNAGGSIG